MSNQPTRSTADSKRRGQAVAGAVSGLVVVIVLFAIFFGVKAAGPGKGDKAAAQPPAAASAPAAAPSAAAPSAAATQAPPNAPAQPAGVRTPPALSKAPVIKAGKGRVQKLTVTPIVKGTGPVVKAGQTLTANYVVATYKDGRVVDSSWQRGQPISTPIGVGQVIKGWDQTLPGQRIGSRLQIDVPAAEAYGEQQGDLRFIVDLLAAR